mmetsp:Transcript_4732/g.13834  ORF Transcript_4732/g.13834 Transcript_4732/m.13834 type:complete len:273 (+) Transcript_4732:209-1027(+)
MLPPLGGRSGSNKGPSRITDVDACCGRSAASQGPGEAARRSAAPLSAASARSPRRARRADASPSHAAAPPLKGASVLRRGRAEHELARERGALGGRGQLPVPPALEGRHALAPLRGAQCELPHANGQVHVVVVVLRDLLAHIQGQGHEVEHGQAPGVEEQNQEELHDVQLEGDDAEGVGEGLHSEQEELLHREEGLQVVSRRVPQHGVQASPEVRDQGEDGHPGGDDAGAGQAELGGHGEGEDPEHPLPDTVGVVLVAVEEAAPGPDCDAQR